MYWAIFFVLLAGLNSTFGNLLLKASRQKLEQSPTLVDQYLSIYFIGAILFYGLNVVLFAKALDHLPVNVGYPILASSGFAMLSISSWVIYGEKLDPLQITGLIVVIVGIGMLSYSITD